MVSKEEVRKIAQLGRINLSEDEVTKMQEELSVILDYFEIVKNIDVSQVEPFWKLSPLENITREDALDIQNPAVREQLLQAAPKKEGNYFKVNAILDD